MADVIYGVILALFVMLVTAGVAVMGGLGLGLLIGGVTVVIAMFIGVGLGIGDPAR